MFRSARIWRARWLASTPPTSRPGRTWGPGSLLPVGARRAGGVPAPGRHCVAVEVVAFQLFDQARVGHGAVDLHERAGAIGQEHDAVGHEVPGRGRMGDFHLPVGVVGRLGLVEGDDGVDQGEAVLPQTRPAGGDAFARRPARGGCELTGGGCPGEAGRGAVPVALLRAADPADQSRGLGAQVPQRTADMVGAPLVRQQQRLQLEGCGQAQPGEGEQDLAAEVRSGLRRGPLPAPGRFSRHIHAGRRGVATGAGRRIRGLISNNAQTAADRYGAGRGARRRGGVRRGGGVCGVCGVGAVAIASSGFSGPCGRIGDRSGPHARGVRAGTTGEATP